MRRARLVLLAVLVAVLAAAQEVRLPGKDGAVRFGVIGDSGTGGRRQHEVALALAHYHAQYPFDFVLMLGDNLYGGERPRDYREKFEEPYATLLAKGVKFYAALGNHDDPAQRFYEGFNMGGKRYYTFQKGGVRFFALDSTYMDAEQLKWLEDELKKSTEKWKVAFFHHPLYSSGRRHGPSLDLRATLEPLFVRYGVNVVFAGHEHFYERIQPQKGIYHFIEGGSAKLRRGNVRPSRDTARYEDRDYTFMVVEIAGDEMFFHTLNRRGQTVDFGALPRLVPETAQPAEATAAGSR